MILQSFMVLNNEKSSLKGIQNIAKFLFNEFKECGQGK